MQHVKKIIGHTRKGKPVYAIAGGSGHQGPPVGDQTQQQPGQGDTITIDPNAPASREGQPGEEGPAVPASTRSVDPAAFGRGVEEQQRAGQQPVPGQTQNPATGRVFTEDEVERIRQQEKDKLYGEIQGLKEEQAAWRKEREDEERRRAEEEARAIEAAKEGEEANMDVRELIRNKESEWNSLAQQLRAEAEEARAMYEQERRFNALSEYKQAQLATRGDEIMPHLLDLVDGNDEQEIDASIERAIEKTNAIMADVAAANQQQVQQVPTSRVTAPGDAGPLEQQTQSTRTFSAEDIRNMSTKEYAQYRDQLRAAAASQYRGGR